MALSHVRTSPLWWILPPVLHGAALALWAAPRTPDAAWTAGSFVLLTAVAAYGLFTDPRPYSINRMFWVFVGVALAVVPSFQVAIGRIPWGAEDLTMSGIHLRTNLVVVACCAAYVLCRAGVKAVSDAAPPRVAGRVDERYRKSHRMWGLALMLVVAIAYVGLLGASRIWLKSTMDPALHRFSDAAYLVAEKLVRGPVLYYALASIFLFRLRKLKAGLLAAALGIFVVVNFPLAMPRVLAAALYTGVLLSFAGRWWILRRQAFTLALLAVLLVVYPLAGLSRLTPTEAAARGASKPGRYWAESFSTGDFDAHAQTARVVQRVHRRGHTGGRQALTALAFAVPRKVWPGKSIGSGALVARESGKKFTNVSCPLIAEGYINFGLAGALLFCGLFGVGAFHYDRYYWHWRIHRVASGDFSFPVLFYPVVLVLAFFLLRGDLLSSLALGVGLYAAGYFFHALLRAPWVRRLARVRIPA